MKKIIHNIKTGEIQEVNLTAEEIAQAETDRQSDLAKQQEYETAKQAKETLKASAKTKLMNGQALTQEEVDTIVL